MVYLVATFNGLVIKGEGASLSMAMADAEGKVGEAGTCIRKVLTKLK